MFNREEYKSNKNKNNNQQNNYLSMLKTLHKNFDVVIISNFIDWSRTSQDNQDNNYTALQVNYTESGLNKIKIDKLLVCPDIKTKILWPNQQFYTENIYERYTEIKLSDFNFKNLDFKNSTSNIEFKDVARTIKPNKQNKNYKINNITNKDPISTNLLLKINKNLFDDFELIKNIPEYNHLL